MGINFSSPNICSCDRPESSDKTSRNRNTNTIAQPPSNPKINSEELLLSDEPSHGLSQAAMDAKTMELLLKFDDSFSPTTSKQKLLAYDDRENIPLSDIPFIPTITEMNRTDQSETDIVSTENDKQILQPEVRRITTDEKDIAPTNTRLIEIQNSANMDELADTIRSNYDTDHSHSESHSSMDEAEKAEIARIKSDQKITKINKSNIFRNNTANPWEEDDIVDLHDEMSQHLINLTKQASDQEINQLSEMSQNIFVPSKATIVEDVDLPDASLYRDMSKEKWNLQLIANEKDGMRKQLMYLAGQTITMENEKDMGNKIVNDNEEDIVYSDDDNEVQYVDHFDDD